MPIGTGIIYNVGDLILSTVSGSGTAFLETKIAAATSSIVYFDSNARINSASLNSITVGTASYVSGSRSIITNLTASNISASGTSSFGYVGIGTNNPTYKLDVNGTSRFANDILSNGNITIAKSSAYLYLNGTNSDSELRFLANGSDRWAVGMNVGDATENLNIYNYTTATTNFTILKTNGNVGIGSTAPNDKLDVVGRVYAYRYISVSSNAASPAYATDTSTGMFNAAANQIGFSISSAEKVRIDGNGNVGIGTTTPGYKLTVQNDAASTNALLGLQNFSTSSTTNHGVSILPILSDNTGSTAITAGGLYWLKEQQWTNDTTSRDSYLRIDTTENGSASEKVRITSAGNVGIGTTVPAYKLHVAGPGFIGRQNSYGTYDAADADLIISNYNNSNTSLLLFNNAGAYHSSLINYYNNILSLGLNNSNSSNSILTSTAINITSTGVGIGTSSPIQILSVIGATEAGVNTSTTGGPAYYIRYDGANGNYINSIGAEYSSGNMILGYGATGKANSAGYVSTFANFSGHRSVLMVGNGTLEFLNSRASLSTTVGSDVPMTSSLYINNSGNVGIGTTSPADKLHVIGNIRINGGDILNWGGQAFIQTIGANDMFFRPNSTLRMILTAAGNLGLGNGFISPAYLLDVSGSSRFGFTSTNTHQFTGSVSISGSLNATASWANNALTASSLVAANSYTITNLTASNIRASATGSFGMVGIGTTIPGAPLDILANDLADGILIRGNDNGNCKIRIVNSGVGGEQFSLTVGYPGASNGSFVIRSITNSSNRYVIGETGAHIWATNAGDAMTLNISGSLGIGTTNPVAKLQVAGNVSGSSFTSSISNAVGFLGTSSWAQNVVSASFATTAQTANALNASNTYTIAGLTSAYVDVNGSSAPTTGIYRPSTKTLGLSADSTLIFKISNVSSPATSSIETGNFIVQTGNVGIGMTTPGAKLQTYATNTGSQFLMSAQDGVNSLNFGLGFSVNSQTFATIAGVYTNSGGSGAGDLTFYTKTTSTSLSEKVRIASDGNVGIGTTSPASKLHISGSGQTIMRLDSDTTTNISQFMVKANTDGVLVMGMSGGSAASTSFGVTAAGQAYIGTTTLSTVHPTSLVIGNVSTIPIVFSTANTEKMRINSDGNVGINQTSPGYKLDVNGTVRVADALAANGNITITKSGANLYINGTNSDAEIHWLANGSDRWAMGMNVGDATENLNIYNYTTATINFTILKTNGNVGIGTSSPGYKLEVNGDLRAGAGSFTNTVTGTKGIFSDASGVGGVIEAYNTVATNATTAIIRQTTAGGNGNQDIGLLVDIQGANDLDRIANFRYYDGSTYTSRMVIMRGGNVGIGTAAPAAKLEISGSSNSALLNIKSPISGAILFVSGSGAVGINTSTVGAYTLQVNGSFAAETKSFVIEHPTKAGKKLIYGSLESPYHGIRLTGRDTLVNGKCKIQLPDYIYKLILHDSVNIQLTGIKCNKTLYVDEINIPENYFTIAYDKAIFESYKDYDFFWDFTGIRTDVPELITEL
jgi:hypothetical protein